MKYDIFVSYLCRDVEIVLPTSRAKGKAGGNFQEA